jgi:hypothetical protein
MTYQQRISIDNEIGFYTVRGMHVPNDRVDQILQTPDEPPNPYAGDSVMGTKYGVLWFPR